jgi:hypothetical protein
VRAILGRVDASLWTLRALGAEVMAWVERPGGGRRVILHKRLVVRAGELHWDDVRGGDAS